MFRNVHDLANYPIMGGPFYRHYSLRVHIHRYFEVGVPERFLNRLHVLSIGLHQSTEAVPQRVPANRLCDLQLVPQDRLEVDPVNRTRPVRLPSLRRRTGEYPILRLVVGATCAPCEQNLRHHFGTDRNGLSRSLRLAAFDPLLDHIADYAKFKALEIDIFPFQAEKFAYPKSGSSGKRHSHPRKIIDQALQKELDLLRRKDRWDSGPDDMHYRENSTRSLHEGR